MGRTLKLNLNKVPGGEGFLQANKGDRFVWQWLNTPPIVPGAAANSLSVILFAFNIPFNCKLVRLHFFWTKRTAVAGVVQSTAKYVLELTIQNPNAPITSQPLDAIGFGQVVNSTTPAEFSCGGDALNGDNVFECDLVLKPQVNGSSAYLMTCTFLETFIATDAYQFWLNMTVEKL